MHLDTGGFLPKARRLGGLILQMRGFRSGPSRAGNHGLHLRAKGMAMKTAHVGNNGFQRILEEKQVELVQVLRKRDGITIETSPDQMDEIQNASERDLAIRNVDQDSNQLRQVKAALQRIHHGSYGTCIDCEGVISPKRLAAVPWAARCIQCQDAADQDRQERTESFSGILTNAA